MAISVEKLGMRFGGKILYQNVDLHLHAGHRYGLVGANGAGKSTLIKLITGEMEADQGQIRVPGQLRIGSLSQDQFVYDQQRILDVVMQGNTRLWQALKDKEELLTQTELSHDDSARLAELEESIQAEDGYRAESEACQLLQGLGVPAERHRAPMSSLSGGYRLRVLLAQLFFSQPDVLLLDEPTNHLDIFSILWLGQYLQRFQGLMIVISHHRDFLNRVCTDMLDVDYGTINSYPGDYDSMEALKAEMQEHKQASLDAQQKKKDDLQGFVDRFRYKASKARQAQSRLRMVGKLEEEMQRLALLPSSRRTPALKFEAERPSGAIALRVEALSKHYGELQVLHSIDLEVPRGEKLALIGPNGIGKSTLLQILTGHNKLSSGSFEWGHAVHIGYFPQDPRQELNPDQTLIDWMEGQLPQVSHEKIRQTLGACLFTGDDVKQLCRSLSGGECARLILAKLMLLNPNVLIFDEPTNHLDMEAIEALIEALNAFAGTVLLVSHNTYFLGRLAKSVVELNSQGAIAYPCDFEEYARQRQLSQESDVTMQLSRLEAQEEEKDSQDGREAYEARKRARNQRKQLEREIQEIETKTDALEAEIRRLDARLADPSFYEETSLSMQQEIAAEKEGVSQSLDSLLHAWEEKSEQLRSLELP